MSNVYLLINSLMNLLSSQSIVFNVIYGLQIHYTINHRE
jgi:hypothetical protein